ncbi:Mis12-Mtw1 protein family-domain-containing protein [Lineolata rhizophorae]|uniref:Mis12-Mtw1 protein family-domain-containing protein n=1 Tax=Lineolata rhizophorae TaxID=578093 RepID=A0A6A6NPK7_9PEZI|nr:Mis12-Mtw1 protein family-domain-containing protein [Lineolata rhizophorae]
MTAVIRREPLQTLNMSSTQRPARRRSARLAFEDDDAPPVKKAKTDATKTSDAGGGKANGARSKKQKISYDEDDDGFQFSRAKSKRTKTKQPQVPEPIQEEQASTASAPKKSTRRQKEPALTAPPAQQDEGEGPTTRRRSARLSGDNIQKTPPPEPTKKRTGKKGASKDFRDDDEVNGIKVIDDALQVEKVRSPTKIALPFADTPVIKRNKEMRKGSGKDGRRRSSTGLRGRRASSLIDSGTSNAVPHSEVETQNFYKHIEQSLPEPRRMKQLLSWCGTRALPEKPSGHVPDSNAIMAARAIQQELLDDFSNKSEMSNWFDREEQDDAANEPLVKQPNPRNVQNAQKLQELEEEVKRLQEEKRSWDTLLKDSSAALSQSSKAKAKASPGEDSERKITQIDASLLDDPAQVEILSSLAESLSFAQAPSLSQAPPSGTSSLIPQYVAEIQSRVRHVTSTLEPTVDIFADGIHKLSQYRLAADRVADRILGSAVQQLEERDRAAKERAGTEGIGTKEVLRALSGALADKDR